MAPVQYDGPIGVRQSGNQNKRVTGDKLSGTKVSCIIIISIAYKLCHMNIR